MDGSESRLFYLEARTFWIIVELAVMQEAVWFIKADKCDLSEQLEKAPGPGHRIASTSPTQLVPN